MPRQPLSLFDVDITDATYPEAARLLENALLIKDRSRAAYFVNAHTLNLARRDASYREILASADYVFGDGAGVHWAVRKLHGVDLCANLNGTDFVPYFLRETTGRGYRIFLLGTREAVVRAAAAEVERFARGWNVCGYHHGFFEDKEEGRVVDAVNQSRPHLLLVAMGNPLQERWIHRNRNSLEVPLAMGVGALFDYWAGVERRAPEWMCRADLEWVYRMIFQRGKLTRYLVGNPEFVWSVARAKWLSNGGHLSESSRPLIGRR